MNNNEHKAELPEEFKEGPWITAQELMNWMPGLGLTKAKLKSARARGILAYSVGFGGIILFNKPWILWRLSEGWTWKQSRPRKKTNSLVIG